MESKKLSVAIIGLGKIGQALAKNLTKGNRSVIVASREFSKTMEFSKNEDSLIPLEITDAIKESDIVIPTLMFNDIKGFLKQYAADLEGKIIIDVSNPIAPDGNGGFKKILAENESSGEVLSELLPKGSKLIKAFGTLGVESLINKAHKAESRVLFYASDNVSINSQIEGLIRDSGFEPLHIGGINQSKRIEVFGELHEFGGLGKSVNLTEAKQLV